MTTTFLRSRRIAFSGLALLLLLLLAQVVSPPTSVASTGPDYCPDRYVCLYRNANWSGMIAGWNGNATTARQYFEKNVASSWQNHSSYNWCVRDDRTLYPDVQIFVMLAGQSQSMVAASANDRADYAYRC